jgi:hypothetical protein
VAEIRSRVKGHGWQWLDAFIGYRDRRLGDHIERISVSYRG